MRNVLEAAAEVFVTLMNHAMEVKYARIEFVKLVVATITCAQQRNRVSTKSVRILAKSPVNAVYALNVQL